MFGMFGRHFRFYVGRLLIKAEAAVPAQGHGALGMVHERPLKLPNPYLQGFNVKRQTFVGPKAHIRV